MPDNFPLINCHSDHERGFVQLRSDGVRIRLGPYWSNCVLDREHVVALRDWLDMAIQEMPE